MIEDVAIMSHFEKCLTNMLEALENNKPASIKFRSHEVIILPNAANVEKMKELINKFRNGDMSFRQVLESF